MIVELVLFCFVLFFSSIALSLLLLKPLSNLDLIFHTRAQVLKMPSFCMFCEMVSGTRNPY